MEKITVLTRRVADNTRCTGASIGEEGSFTLHSTEMNYTGRYGVYKGTADTLISFLHMTGFEAYSVMTMAGSHTKSIPADHFSHCVAAMKLASGIYIPLDPTWIPFCRELWSSAERQQNYLSGIPGGPNSCLTLVSAPGSRYVRVVTESKLDAKGALRDTLSIIVEGQSDSNICHIFTQGWQAK